MKNIKFIVLLGLVCGIACAGDYSIVAKYSNTSGESVYAIDVNQTGTYLVSSSADKSIQQYELVNTQNTSKQIKPCHTYNFELAGDPEIYIRYGKGKAQNRFYVQGSEGAWFKDGISKPLGITTNIATQFVSLVDTSTIDQASRILAGRTVSAKTLSAAIVLFDLSGKNLREYLLHNKNVNDMQSPTSIIRSQDDTQVAASIAGTLACALWDFETGICTNTVEKNEDDYEITSSIVQIPQKDAYCIANLYQLMRYDQKSNVLDELYRFNAGDGIFNKLVFLDAHTLIAGGFDDAYLIDLRKSVEFLATLPVSGVANSIHLLSPDSFIIADSSDVITQWKK